MTHTSKGFKAKPYSICDADSPGPEHEHRRITLLKLDTLGWISGSKVNKRRLTLPRIRQASAASCSTPVLLWEWSWKRNQQTKKRQSEFQRFLLQSQKNWKTIWRRPVYFGGSLILFHAVVWCIWSVHVCRLPYLVSTVLRVGLLEVAQGLHYCRGTLHIGIIYHDVTCLCA